MAIHQAARYVDAGQPNEAWASLRDAVAEVP